LIRLNALTHLPVQAASLRAPEGCRMLDVAMLAIGLIFFALSVGYTIACDRL
jgi:hypothetical protein